jgi:hypothetical protein
MKLVPLIIAFLVAPMLLSNSAKHEYYVSVTKIEYAKEQQSLQVITQIFINDFEKLLRKRYDETIVLNGDIVESETVEKYMNRYLSDKLKININGASVDFKYIGKEYKDDITYCYLEIENISEIKSIEVTNRTLFDIIPEQQNIVRLKLLDRNKSFLLLPENDKCMLNFN